MGGGHGFGHVWLIVRENEFKILHIRFGVLIEILGGLVKEELKIKLCIKFKHAYDPHKLKIKEKLLSCKDE